MEVVQDDASPSEGARDYMKNSFQTGFRRNLNFKNVPGPWVRQVILITGKVWYDDCVEPDDTCVIRVVEAFRVLKPDGSATGFGEVGQTHEPDPRQKNKDGSPMKRWRGQMLSQTTDRSTIGNEWKHKTGWVGQSDVAQTMDRHNLEVLLSGRGQGSCNANWCKLIVDIEAELYTGCAEPLITIGGGTMPTSPMQGHVLTQSRFDFILEDVEIIEPGCVCSQADAPGWAGPLGLPITWGVCTGPVIKYRYDWQRERCEADHCKGGLPPPSGGHVPPPGGRPPVITPRHGGDRPPLILTWPIEPERLPMPLGGPFGALPFGSR